MKGLASLMSGLGGEKSGVCEDITFMGNISHFIKGNSVCSGKLEGTGKNRLCNTYCFLHLDAFLDSFILVGFPRTGICPPFWQLKKN